MNETVSVSLEGFGAEGTSELIQTPRLELRVERKPSSTQSN
jgi:hypothetical protein